MAPPTIGGGGPTTPGSRGPPSGAGRLPGSGKDFLQLSCTFVKFTLNCSMFPFSGGTPQQRPGPKPGQPRPGGHRQDKARQQAKEQRYGIITTKKKNFVPYLSFAFFLASSKIC